MSIIEQSMKEINGIKYYFMRNKLGRLSVYVQCPRCGGFGRLNLGQVCNGEILMFRILHDDGKYHAFSRVNRYFPTLFAIYTDWKETCGNLGSNIRESVCLRKIINELERLKKQGVERVSVNEILRRVNGVNAYHVLLAVHKLGLKVKIG
ncbi:hypothetical protein [Archaeoglobus profundus]|nr:hypothetical protein [Archaeoglobus profundus]